MNNQLVWRFFQVSISDISKHGIRRYYFLVAAHSWQTDGIGWQFTHEVWVFGLRLPVGKRPGSARLAVREHSVFRNGTLGYDRKRRMILGAREVMATGTVKSFNRLKGYGFIRAESGKEVFVHLSAVQKAGLADLRKGQKISFEIFENQGRAAAKNLRSNRKRMENVSEDKLVSNRSQVSENLPLKMSPKKNEEHLNGKRTSITRASLELTIADAARSSSQDCSALVGIIVERVVPESPGGANWAVKGVKYGKAERDRCSATLFKCVEEGQRDFEVSD